MLIKDGTNKGADFILRLDTLEPIMKSPNSLPDVLIFRRHPKKYPNPLRTQNSDIQDQIENTGLKVVGTEVPQFD